jgi:hypothetical protein
MGVYVVRAFVRLRGLLASNTALARKLDELERKYHDDAIKAILSAIRELMNPTDGPRSAAQTRSAFVSTTLSAPCSTTFASAIACGSTCLA